MSKYITLDRGNLPENTFVKEDLTSKMYNFTWKIKFNNTLDSDTVNNTSMFVTSSDGSLFGCKIVYNSDNNYIEIHPTELYKPNETYTLTITTRVKSVSGSSLPNDISVPFSISE